MISFIEFADYVVGPLDSLCENGMIDNLSECKKAANQLNLYFGTHENVTNYPGGCYVVATVYFNENFAGTSHKSANPICGQGK